MYRVPDGSAPTPWAAVWQQTRALLRALTIERLDALPEREQSAVHAYYALDGQSETPPTLKELADRIGVRAAISAQQILRRGVAALLDPASVAPTLSSVTFVAARSIVPLGRRGTPVATRAWQSLVSAVASGSRQGSRSL